MSTHKAKCDKCSYEADFSDPLRSYEMADGSTVTIERTFVWCSACREVRWGEQLTDLAQLERDLAATSAREPAVMEELSFSVSRHQTLEDLLASRKKELESRIAWRRIRKSPARCLECGSTDITPLVLTETDDGDEKWTLREHPGCGGIVTVLSQMVLSIDRRWFRYTPEGKKKQAYDMYPSKGAVPIDG
jgi:hypothetical protein